MLSRLGEREESPKGLLITFNTFCFSLSEHEHSTLRNMLSKADVNAEKQAFTHRCYFVSQKICDQKETGITALMGHDFFLES